MSFTRDYLIRQIEQLNKALATMLRQRDEQRYDDALDTLGDTYDELLGHAAHVLATLTPQSAATMLGKWPRIRIYAALLAGEAEVLTARGAPGEAERAARLRIRALQLTLLGLGHGGRGDPALQDTAKALLPQVDLAALDPRSLASLKELGLVR